MTVMPAKAGIQGLDIPGFPLARERRLDGYSKHP
jgi:hypothetical protein